MADKWTWNVISRFDMSPAIKVKDNGDGTAVYENETGDRWTDSVKDWTPVKPGTWAHA